VTTWPCTALSSGQNSRVSRTAPKYFSAKPSRKASSGSSRKLPARVRPALLTRMSQRPNFFFDARKHLLAAGELAQVAGDGERRGTFGGDRLGGGGEVIGRG